LLEQEGAGEVPDHLKDANRDAEGLGHGQGYEYPHEHPDHFIGQGYLPDELLGTYFYRPSDQGYELLVRDRLDRWRQAQRLALELEATQEIPELSEQELQAIKRQHARAGSSQPLS
jgi:replication-associated recombination protein RarA